MKLLIASGNLNKIREIREIAYKIEWLEIVSPLDLSLNLSIIEDGKTLHENALKKAQVYLSKTGYCSLGEDTGLEVEILKGMPGVYSARYSGNGDNENRKKLLSEMEGMKNRNARFRTVMVLAYGKNKTASFEGMIKGNITRSERGSGGFGYDPIFVPSGYKQTFAEMPESLKNSISHRSNALEKVLEFIKREEETLSIFCSKNNGV